MGHVGASYSKDVLFILGHSATIKNCKIKIFLAAK
jgi:hypothetical protein